MGVRRENDILILPQVGRTLFNEAVSCIARSAPYLQCPTEEIDSRKRLVTLKILIGGSIKIDSEPYRDVKKGRRNIANCKIQTNMQCRI